MRDHTKLRAAVSLPSNIVEGCACESQVEYLRFLETAFGSLRELHYQFSVARRLGYLSEPDISECDLKLVKSEKVLCRTTAVHTQRLTAFSPNNLSSYISFR